MSGAEGARGGATVTAGVRHLRAEWGRWWRTDDLTDTHIAHHVLNDQYRLWQKVHQRTKSEVHQSIGLLKRQQKQTQLMQMQRMQMQKKQRSRGGYGYGGGMGMMGGASPMISYRMMQWSGLQIRIGQQEFRHTEVTPNMLAIGRGQVRSRRHLAASGLLLGLGAAWAGLWALSLVAGLTVTALAVLVVTTWAWIRGRNPVQRRPPVPKLLFVPATPPANTELVEPEPVPFPLREAGRDPKRTQEAVRLALQKEKAQVKDIGTPTQTDWGWNVPLRLSGGTIADLMRKLPNLTTPLEVGDGRILATRPDPNNAALVRLRILTSDPFANPLPYPVRAPLSQSITQPVSIGLSIDGETTPIVLAGQHVLIVADSGGGKSGMTRMLAEWTTSCADAVAVDLDPSGRGLGPLRACAAKKARTTQETEQLLEELLERTNDRITALGDTDDNWPVSEQSPAIVAFIDEYPGLTKRGKEAALAILRRGRKARITLVICTQDATADVMGDAIADSIGVRILMPCRAADVPLVVGRADAISRGWLPHLLVPSPGEWEQADAGRYYCVTPRHRDPVLRYVSHLDATTARERARERVAAGLPAIDGPAPATTPSALPGIAQQLLGAFAAAGAEVLTVAQIGEHLATSDPTWRQWDERDDRIAMIGRRLRRELKKAGLDGITSDRLEELEHRPRGYRLRDVKAGLP